MDHQPLQELRLRDFRCFREQQTARLAPLTLLLGDNSTGKTSFLAAVKAILEVASYHKDPDFRSAPYDLGSFHEIAHHPQDSRLSGAESFSIGFECTGNMVESVEFDATFTLGKGASPRPCHRSVERRRCVDQRPTPRLEPSHRTGLRERLLAAARFGART